MSALIDGLIRNNVINADQLRDARDKKAGAKKPLQDILVDMGFVTEEDIVRTASDVFGMPITDLEKEDIDPKVTSFISYESARKHGVLPLRKEQGRLIVAMSDPQDVIVIDDISLRAGMPVKPVLGKSMSISRKIEEVYGSDESIYDILKNVVEESKVRIVNARSDDDLNEDDLKDINVENSPVVRLVDLILGDSLKARASDIHIEPMEKFTDVRYRIDGDLKSIMKIPPKLHDSVCARIKIMSELNIAEKRKAQDGRTSIEVNEREVDLRVSVIPTFHGEKIVIRLLDTDLSGVELDHVGFNERELRLLKEKLTRTQGMILFTGPTGSGKTTSLYAILNYLKSEITNVVTVEDPVEYLLEGVNQVQVNPRKDITFAGALKSILRQDPNVILVGEIRDRETADIAFRSSMTGHLVLSTLHTNNSVASVFRLLDIGLEPYLISSSLIVVVAQRLVKMICPDCKEECVPEQTLLDRYRKYIEQEGIESFYRGKGCEKCGFTGYRGRMPIFEILDFDREIKKLVSSGAGEEQIFARARKNGMNTLVESGMALVAKGKTTLEQLSRSADIVDEAPAKAEGARTDREQPYEDTKAVNGETDRQKILIVDDEPDIRKVLAKRLEMAGYQVLIAEDGKQGVEAAVREKPDLIVMDVMMPVMDGIEATRALRSRLETAVIPVLMLTAKKDKDSELEGIDAGADDYVTKPFDSEKLRARIKMLLRRR